MRQRQVVRVVDLPRLAELLLLQHAVLLCAHACVDDVALLEIRVRRLDDFGHTAIVDDAAELEGSRVGLDVRRAHAATLVRVEGDITGKQQEQMSVT